MKRKAKIAMKRLVAVAIAAISLFQGACELNDNEQTGSSDSDSNSDSAGDTDSDSDSDTDTDSDSDSDTDGDVTGIGSLHGTVLSPTQQFPISGALVYLLQEDPPEIPEGVYNYECDEMTNEFYTLSTAAGTWEIKDIPSGTWKIVTRKGNFRRVREITVEAGEDIAVPFDHTTLPGSEDIPGDTIPDFAVVHTEPDKVYNLLAKFGMGESAGGVLIYGTETFELYNDSGLGSAYPTTSMLFETQETLNQHQMIFLPCFASVPGVAFAEAQAEKIQSFIAAGGKLYNSCCVALWIEAPFPEYIDFSDVMKPDNGTFTAFDIGRISNIDYSTNGEVLDEGLAEWLKLVTDQDPENYPFTMGYVKIDGTVDVDDGHGLEEDDGWVKPYTWVVDKTAYPGSPLIVTYNYDFGKVFYTVYETSAASSVLTPQEYVLIYVILEVGVCENLPIVL